MLVPVHEDFDRCYRAVQSKDQRFDGWFVTAVRTTRIYCRPSCPVRPPLRQATCSFYPTAAAAQQAGYRACKRCRPDASPGSPEWDVRADLVARAMRLIADGTVDRDGVGGLAAPARATAPRQLERLLLAEVGAGPLALARAQRAQTARLLIETTRPRLRRPRLRRRLLAASASSTTPCARCSPPRPPSCRRKAPQAGRPRRLGHRRPRLPPPVPHAVRAGQRVRPPRGHRGARRARSTATAPTAARCACPTARRRVAAAHARPRGLPAAPRRPPRPAHRHRPLPTAARPRRGPRGRRRGAGRRPRRCGSRRRARSPAAGCPAPSTRPSWRVRVVLGQQVSTAAARTHAGRLVQRHGTPVDRSGRRPHPRLPLARGRWPSSTPSSWRCPPARRRCLTGLVGALADGAALARPRHRPRARSAAGSPPCPASGRGPSR